MSYELSPLPLPEHRQAGIEDVTVIMPIGGKATRARSVTNDEIPKHLIRLGNGQTVLDTITRGLQRVGFKDFVFCLGHHSDQLASSLENGEWKLSEETTHRFSLEDRPLGPDGAIMQAVGDLGIKGQAMIIPGDLMLPWESVREMNLQHARQGNDVTMGVTSYITPRTTDVGKIIGETGTGRLLWCYPRSAEGIFELQGAENLTSAAATAISVERYQELCGTYLDVQGSQEPRPLSLRDEIAPWVAQEHPGFDMRVFDIQGEILDLGTPDNIRFGQQNWSLYV